MPLTSDEWQVIKDLRDEMADLRDFCEGQNRIATACCNDPDAECPIAMGEWWDNDKNEKLKRVSGLLFPDA